MSVKVHCDLCDAVIPPTVLRLTLSVGIWKVGMERNDEECRDLCGACVDEDPILKSWFHEQLTKQQTLVATSFTYTTGGNAA